MSQDTTVVAVEPPATPPPLNAVETARWAWRALTSMRTALILLLLLALGAIPGSLIPQRSVDPVAVAGFRRDNPELSRWYDRLSLFDVFTSPWFSAIYLLLMVSLVGCLVPRTKVYLRGIRARPPVTPRHLRRLPEYRRVETDADPLAVIEAVTAHLRDRRFRLDRHTDSGGQVSVAAERGYLRETGNLVFHLSLIVVLIGIALGYLFGVRGSALVIEGEGFANTVTQYDNLRPGPLYDLDSLDPYTVTLRDFRARYEETGSQIGAPRDFEARVGLRERPGAPVQERSIRVNEPLQTGGAKMILGPHGYAPVVTVRDGRGDVVFSGAVPFLPIDPRGLTSRGVIKVPDSSPKQLGFQGFFLPTAAFDIDRGPFSTFPEPRNPRLVLNVFAGDLGLDDGVSQSVYRLDTDQMIQLREGVAPDAEPLTESLVVGATMDLPDGLGSLTFDGYREWVVLQIADDPGRLPALLGGVLALSGLLASLFIRSRRVWVRAGRDEGGRTVVEIGALARSEGSDLSVDVDLILAAIGRGEPPESTGGAVSKNAGPTSKSEE
ncbi:MAG: cytochrome c biogenesis protein ResB [Sporichthyaceae bacterium]